jgi:hypothetical protein
MINVGILQAIGRPEPWFVAMDVKPPPSRTLDYGMHWGIDHPYSFSAACRKSLSWKDKKNLLSPSYTTRWDQLAIAFAR